MFELFLILFVTFFQFSEIDSIAIIDSPSFICIDGSKINLTDLCNGKVDCPDSSDEVKKLCHHIVCPKDSYRCSYGACIKKTRRCDGFEDCIDGSDELHCDVPATCTDREYQCFQSLECIPITSTCNGYPDCADESDETATHCRDFPCPLNTYQCTYGGCVHFETICDGTNDCLDGSDEESTNCAAINCRGDDCRAYSCHDDEFRCQAGGQCIHISRVCDGTYQCRDGSDEDIEICKNQQCPQGFFRCDYGGCIPESFVCNLKANCHDWSDENETICGVVLPDGACRLPPAKTGTHYHVYQCPDCYPGKIVPELSRLDFQCAIKDSLEGNNYVYCQNNQWVPYLPTCYAESQAITCPPLNAPGAKKRCEVLWGPKQGWIPCNDSSPVGTHVTLECPEFYEKETGAAHTTCLHDGTWSQQPLHCRPICGIRTISVAALIVRGWELSREDALPWHATLFSHQEGHWNFFCGGTLIGERAVLTAGHCVWKTDPNTIRVIFAGFTSNFTIDEQDETTQIRDVLKIELQKNYQDHEGNYGSDIAILILRDPVIINSNVRPACLSNAETDILIKIDEMGLVAGMGITENGTFSQRLRVTSVKIIPEEECRNSQKRDFRKYLTYTTFCAGWKNGTAVCNGDSGGGLVLQRFNSTAWDLYGVVSISQRRIGASICDPNYYTVFTKISIYSSWIENILKNLTITGPPDINQLPNNDVIRVHRNKTGVSTSLVMIGEVSEYQDITQEIDLPNTTVHDDVLITPSYMKFKDAIEGITLRECLTIRNIGKKVASIRIHEPNSIAFKIKTLKRGAILSPGLALKRWVSYSFKRPALLHASIPIEINGHVIDYQIVCIFNMEYIEIAPRSVDFGIVDIGCSSGMRLLTISNIGGKSTRFTIDLGNNDMDINVKPHRGVVRPRSTVELHVRMIGINEGTFFNEFWIKSTPNIRVTVTAKIIIPRLEINYPNTTGDFTLVDFSSTFFGVKKYDTLTLKNMSSQFSSFVVLAEIGNQLVPFQEIDLIKYPEFDAFDISPVEGRLESFHSIGFILSFHPVTNVTITKNKIHPNQDFMIFIRIVRVHCTEVEDILRAEKRSEPRPDDPPLHKVHIQDGSIFSTDTSGSSVALSHGSADLVRLCLHGEAEVPQLHFEPNELHFRISKLDEAIPQITLIINLSEKSSVTISFIDSSIASCTPSEMFVGPRCTVTVSINITGRHMHISNMNILDPNMEMNHSSNNFGFSLLPAECSFNLNFNVIADSIDAQSRNVKVNIATYSVRCFLTMDITKLAKPKTNRTTFETNLNHQFPYRFIEIEKCRPLTLKSLGLTNVHRSKQSIKSIDTTTMSLSPLQIYNVKVSPTMFVFGSVAQRIPSCQELTFENRNKFPVMVHLASLSPKNIRFLLGDRIILKPDQSILKHVEFRGDQIGKFNSHIDYVINDHHTYELALTADVNYKYLTLSMRQIILGTDYLPQESYRPLESYLELKNRLDARTNFKWEIPTTASYIIDPFIGAVRGKKNVWINVSHISDFIKSDQGEVVVICESGHQETLKLNTILPSLKVAFLNDVIDVGEIGLNFPHKVKSVLHNAGNIAVLFQVDSTDLPHGCDVHPQRGIISPRGIIIIHITMQFRICVQFTVKINVVIEKKKNLTLRIKGEVFFPKIKFTPNEIEMGRISAQSYRIYQLSATNNGNFPVKLQFFLDDFPEFCITSEVSHSTDPVHENITIVVSPRTTHLFYLHFQPVNLASYGIYLPIIINDLLGPVIFGNHDTLQSRYYTTPYKGFYNNIDGVRMMDTSTVMSKIHIHGTVIGQILTYNKLHFSFNVQKNTLEDILKIVNISTLKTPFTVHIHKLSTSESPFSIEWDSGEKFTHDSHTELITCYLSPNEEINFRIKYKPVSQRFSSTNIEISALGEFEAKMFNKIHLEGINLMPSITSDRKEIFFNPIPLMIQSERIFNIILNNYSKNTMFLSDVEEPQKHSGIFTKDLLTITFPTGNLSVTNKESEEMKIRLLLRSEYSVSFQTRIVIHDEKHEAILFITVYGIVDNCLLTIHCYPIAPNNDISVDKNQFDTHQSSYPSQQSKTSENESKINMNCSHVHMIGSQPQVSTHSIASHTSISPKLFSTRKLRSSVTNDDIEDEVDIAVVQESKPSSTLPEATNNQPRYSFAHPHSPTDFNEIYEQHMRRTIDAIEKWMYSDPLKFQFNPDISCGITAVLSGICSLKRVSSDKRKNHTIDKSFLNILVEICGREIYDRINISESLPVDHNERINSVLKTYDKILSFLLSQNAHVSHITSEFLLNYDDYCTITQVECIPESVFEVRSKQSWLDLILQTYKQFVLSKIKTNAIEEIANDTAIHQSIDIIHTMSSTSCLELLPKSDINLITKKAKDKNHFEAEAILLSWLEYHYEQQCTESWLYTHHGKQSSMKEKINLQQRVIDNFECDLMDSLVLITVTASYCPYLIDEYFGNIFIEPRTPEEHLHNAICIVRAWRKIRLGFIIIPQDIVHPNSVQMLMLVVRLFQMLPTYLPRNMVKFSCPLTDGVVRHIGFNNMSESPVSLVMEFFGNGADLFSIVGGDSVLNLNSRDSKTIKIKYHARKITKTRAYVLFCGSAIGPHFASNYCFILEGYTSSIRSTDEFKIYTEMYCIADKIIGIKVPYKFETDYDISITEDISTKPLSLKMTRWSDLRKKKVPHRLFINQKTLAVLENAYKANLSITLGCIVPDTRNFWLIFQAKVGDFVILITSIPRPSLTNSIDVEWTRGNCICTLPKILDTCPLNIRVKIPSRNVQLWNCINKMFQKCLKPREQTFWSKQLDTNIGLKLIHWLLESHEDNTAREFIHIFNKDVDYTISVSQNENRVLFPHSFNICDVRELYTITEMKIHLSETLPEFYSTAVTLISRDEREQRKYSITFICKT